MKRIVFFCAALLTFSACSNNDEVSIQISEDTRTSFQEMYPGAKSVGWEQRGIYRVAKFTYDGDKLLAWYNQDGVWCMTEKRVDINAGPIRVTSAHRTASENPNNANYVDQLTRDGIEDIYVVVEGSGSNRKEYYYSNDGILVKMLEGSALCTYDDYRYEIVPQIPAVVYSTVNELYSGARIMEVDVIFPASLCLEIIHQSNLKTVEFTLTGSWTETMWAVTESHVKTQCPDVYAAYKNLGYTDSCNVVSINFHERSSISFYWFILNNNGTTTEVKISPEGNIMKIS